jgi:hypothetical protein
LIKIKGQVLPGALRERADCLAGIFNKFRVDQQVGRNGQAQGIGAFG